MSDPRAAVVAKRLAAVRRVLLVASGKGGVGKSTCAALAAVLAARCGLRTGLLDLDFQGASCHTILGCSPGLPEESGGILPVSLDDRLAFMSVVCFTGERSLALRGSEAADALLELLAVTVWGELDLLWVDMPPGAGDVLLEMLRLAPQSRVVAVTTPSRVAVAVVARLLDLLSDSGAAVEGVLANMAANTLLPGIRAPVLGAVPYDPGLERALGSPEALAATEAARVLASILTDRAFFLDLPHGS